MISSYDPQKTGSQTVTITYGSMSCTFEVNVRADSVTAVTLGAFPASECCKGSQPDLTGAFLNVVYESGRTGEIPVTAEMLTGLEPDRLGEQTVTITYEGFSCTVTINVIDDAITEIVLKTLPKTEYSEGEKFDITGAVIEVIHLSGKTEEVNVTEDMTEGCDTSAPGTKTVTITYAGKSCTFEVTVKHVLVYDGAMLVCGSDEYPFDTLSAAFAKITALGNTSADYEIHINTKVYEKSLAFPAKAHSIELITEGKGVISTDAVSLAPKCSLVLACNIENTKKKAIAVKTAKDKTLTIKRTFEGLGALSGTATSKLDILTDAVIPSISKFGSVSTHDYTLTVTGKATGIGTLDGVLAAGTQTDITSVGTAHILLNTAYAAKTTVSGVTGKLTITADNGKALTSGTRVFTYKGKSFPWDSVEITNLSADGETLNAYYYKSGNAVKAEFGGALKLTDSAGTDIGMGSYPNLDLAFEAMTGSNTDYILTLMQDNVPFTKLTMPSKARSLTIRGGGHTLDLGKNKTLTAKCALTLDNVTLTANGADAAVKTGKFDLTLTDSVTGAVTTTGKLTVNGNVKAYGAVSAAQLDSRKAGTKLTLVSLAVTKSGIAAGASPIRLTFVKASKEIHTFRVTTKTGVTVVKTFKLPTGGTYTEGSLYLDPACGTGKLVFRKNKLWLV